MSLDGLFMQQLSFDLMIGLPGIAQKHITGDAHFRQYTVPENEKL